MRTVGHRRERPITDHASADSLAEGVRFNEAIHRLPSGGATHVRKGVHLFRTHAEANQHDLERVVAGIVLATLGASGMEEFSRAATLEDVKNLIRALNEQGVEYLLIGWYALFAHGYHRATTDIDILVPATVEAGGRVKRALMMLPDQSARELEPEWFEEGENIRIADEFVVDVMLNACGETYETLKHYEETVLLEGIPVRTVSLEGLLRTKQTLREKDAADRVVLERALAMLRAQSLAAEDPQP